MVKGSADQFMNSYLTPQNIALGVVYLRNSRAITCDIRLDGDFLTRNLLRPELISASLIKVLSISNDYMNIN
jgi:hypothetical protein